MCGLVLIGGSYLTERNLSVFDKMLQCDTYRGSHSTGAFAGFKLASEWQYNLAKAAVDGFDFVKSKTYLETIRAHRETRTYAGAIKPVITTTAPKFIFGHNRYATVGAVNGKNAHPFQHGNITLAHNGTLLTQSLLPDHTMFEVDSENVCHSVNKIGSAETIQKLDGAFTLIWHDKSDNTVHVIRNDERPFHFWETTAGDWFGCSEEKMGDWLLSRGNLPVSVKRHFEAEVGTEYVFDVEGGFKLVSEIKHTLPVFEHPIYNRSTSSRYAGWDDYDAYYGWGGSSYRGSNVTYLPSAKKDPIEVTIEGLFRTHAVPIKLGDRIEFYTYHSDPVKDKPNSVMVSACMHNHRDCFVEVNLTMNKEDYQQDTEYTGEVVSAYEQNNVLVVLVKDPKLLSSEPIVEPPSDEDDGEVAEALLDMLSMDLSSLDDEPPFDLETRKIPESGEEVTREQWGNRTDSVCIHCNNDIAFEDIEDCESFHNQLVCPDCCSVLSEEVEDTNYFCCTGCAQEVPEKYRSPDYPLMCIECAKMFKNEAPVTAPEIPRRSTVTGLHLTPMQWSRINSCTVCDLKIPFYLIETTKFIGNAPVCENCENKLKK